MKLKCKEMIIDTYRNSSLYLYLGVMIEVIRMFFVSWNAVDSVFGLV